ncbi:hypothetical protein BDV25DRAFT_167390 [Aspergillus avenaceus]|uniref:Uncharacterized protein n=1 Tax=Aspergillus avenaceus TaxID=36643 RepID=A0A5N6TCV8_ASPAV|nr:hypothetical protein BDV25DRAFT_167390 [Aspergillus avenaceus]
MSGLRSLNILLLSYRSREVTMLTLIAQMQFIAFSIPTLICVNIDFLGTQARKEQGLIRPCTNMPE